MSEDETFISTLRAAGGSSGNISLQRSLGWDESRYLSVRDRLLEQDVVSLGKGRGGSVRLVEGDMRELALRMPVRGRITHKRLLAQLEWEEPRYAAAVRRLWKEQIVEFGPRGTLSYAGTPEAEEWLLLLIVPNAVSAPFDHGKVASFLGWTEQQIWEVRARCIEKAHQLDVARSRGARKQRATPGARAARGETDGGKAGLRTQAPANRSRAKKQKVDAFVAYSRVDQKLRERLYVHLAALRRTGKIDDWSDQEILAGEEWSTTIRGKLDDADLVLLLISADFLHSDYCYGTEMKRALERHKDGSAWVVPIILRPCDWKSTPLLMLQALPSEGVAITEWPNEDAAFVDVVKEVHAVVERIRARRGG